MKSLILKQYGKNEISFYLAVEEYLLDRYQEDIFFLWDLNKSIIIGRNQLIDAEVNVKFVREIGAKIYRRPSGGGAIFADEGCFMFTFVSKTISKEEAFKKYLALMVKALQKMGIDAYFSGRNDLMFKEKKFSGNAYYQTEKGSILHGTFLFKTNLENLVRSITPDNEKLISKGIKSVSERVINIGDYTNISQEQLMDSLLEEMSQDKIYLDEDEYQKIKRIEKKYLSDEWIIGENPPYTFKNEKRFPFGKLMVYIDVKKKRINKITFKGDFLILDNLELFSQAFIGEEFCLKNIKKVLSENDISKYIMNSNNEQFLSLIFEEEYCGSTE
ncbi:MAG: lipoate--protein ligase [Bacilli bacterium]|nr:lipoate--protein ligase [Bacilli bacterium]